MGIRNPYAESYAEGLTWRSYAKVQRKSSFQGQMRENPSIAREAYAEAFRGASRNFCRICYKSKVFREPSAEVFHGSLAQSYFSMANAGTY